MLIGIAIGMILIGVILWGVAALVLMISIDPYQSKVRNAIMWIALIGVYFMSQGTFLLLII